MGIFQPLSQTWCRTTDYSLKIKRHIGKLFSVWASQGLSEDIDIWYVSIWLKIKELWQVRKYPHLCFWGEVWHLTQHGSLWDCETAISALMGVLFKNREPYFNGSAIGWESTKMPTFWCINCTCRLKAVGVRWYCSEILDKSWFFGWLYSAWCHHPLRPSRPLWRFRAIHTHGKISFPISLEILEMFSHFVRKLYVRSLWNFIGV